MDYVDIVTKIKNNEKLSSGDITGVQLINLVRNKVIKDIVYKGIRYEINFIPITFSFTAIDITEEAYPKFRDAEDLITRFINCYYTSTECYVKISEEYFEIVLDVLETP